MIKTLRDNKGITQKELAKNMKCSIQQIRKIEQNPEYLQKCSTEFTYNLWCELIVNNGFYIEYIDLKDFIIEAITSKGAKYMIENKKLTRI